MIEDQEVKAKSPSTSSGPKEVVTKPAPAGVTKPVKKETKGANDDVKPRLSITIGSNEYTINGKTKTGNLAPFIGNKDIFIPMEYISAEMQTVMLAEGTYLLTKKGR